MIVVFRHLHITSSSDARPALLAGDDLHPYTHVALDGLLPYLR